MAEQHAIVAAVFRGELRKFKLCALGEGVAGLATPVLLDLFMAEPAEDGCRECHSKLSDELFSRAGDDD